MHSTVEDISLPALTTINKNIELNVTKTVLLSAVEEEVMGQWSKGER